jgi:hypothetical protein
VDPGPGWRRPPEGDLLLLHTGVGAGKHLLRRHRPPPPPAPPATECSITGPCTAKGLTLLRNISFLDACKAQALDCDYDAPPGTAPFENCEAVETFIRAAYGKTGTGNFGDCCQCLKASLTQWGGGRVLQQLYPDQAANIIAEIGALDCGDDDADDV